MTLIRFWTLPVYALAWLVVRFPADVCQSGIKAARWNLGENIRDWWHWVTTGEVAA